MLLTVATVGATTLYMFKTLAIYGGQKSDYPARKDGERESFLRAGVVNTNAKSEGSRFKSGQKHFNPACNQQVFTSADESSEEIPIVIFVGRKQTYRFLYRVLDSVKAAHFYGKNDRNYRQKRLCFLLVDDDRGRDMNIVLSRKAKRSFSKLCRKIVMLRSHGIQSKLYAASHVKIPPNDATAKARHLKQLWVYFINKVFQHPLLTNYDGDLLFLEDDLLLSKDSLIALDFLVAAKNGQIDHEVVQSASSSLHNVNFEKFQYTRSVYVVALSGWGGENLMNADPNLFITHTQKNFPTMGYAFNRSFFNLLKSNGVFQRMIGVETDRVTDWSISLTDQILETVLNRSPALLTLSPTLSRIYHFSATSLVGNVHKSITNFKSTPWNKFEERNQLLSSNDHSCLAPYLYDWNGIPCTPIFSQDGSTRFTRFSDVLSNHPWLGSSSKQKKLEDIFKHVKCSFHDLKKNCNMNFEHYVEDCKDKNSYLYPLRMRYNVLKLSDSITFWAKFGPAWRHFDEKRLKENT